ncbi:hypothetical protein THAOC_34538 [Thalassiosira oceanica]|uniref:Transposable element P transposase-like GTP-binding insertion domain-containing protein n=2 Tax=Thalassiosira oceanica TaxID=159749 RepID=K0R2C3_THAOC|nr:hypothetical protein THAOC_34538 [Thalassiosira oceanica]|eukprot:EJK46778.1 hypothetical protein THAOC_34538 [Thalassiosira oceanica]
MQSNGGDAPSRSPSEGRSAQASSMTPVEPLEPEETSKVTPATADALAAEADGEPVIAKTRGRGRPKKGEEPARVPVQPRQRLPRNAKSKSDGGATSAAVLTTPNEEVVGSSEIHVGDRDGDRPSTADPELGRKRKREDETRVFPYTANCPGIYNGLGKSVLYIVGRALSHTAKKLMDWSREEDGGAASFKSSELASSQRVVLPFNGVDVKRADDPSEGFVLACLDCLETKEMTSSDRTDRCQTCVLNRKSIQKNFNKMIGSSEGRPHKNTNMRYVVLDPTVAQLEIAGLRDDVKILRRRLAMAQLDRELEQQGRELSEAELARVKKALDKANGEIEKHLSEPGNEEELELWQIHYEHIKAQAANGGKKRGRAVRCHPVLMNWAIAFLAKTSLAVYREVAKIMLLPDIRHVQRETAKLVSDNRSKAYSICIKTLETLSKRANDDGWTDNQRRVVIAQDSANINATVEHDLNTNMLVGGDESHKLSVLSSMFHTMAESVRKSELVANGTDESGEVKKGGVLDNLRLAHEHLVFKITSIDPHESVKGSPIVASINIEKVTPQIIATVTYMLIDLLPIYGFSAVVSASDAAGCNWAAYKAMGTVSLKDIIDNEVIEKYNKIDFDLVVAFENEVTGERHYIIPDLCHLGKNLVTCLELSSNKSSQRDLKNGKAPVNLRMGEHCWLATGGGSNQLQETKLTNRHWDRNAYSRMNVLLAFQVLSASCAAMIRNAISDEEIKLPIENKGVYNHLANFCDNMNTVIDICNGRDGPHTPENAVERQTLLLEKMQYFFEWKELHDKRVKDEEATEYNFFADETWFCLRALILVHVALIQEYCIKKKVSINPKSLNTDVCEWFFGNGRQMVETEEEY